MRFTEHTKEKNTNYHKRQKNLILREALNTVAGLYNSVYCLLKFSLVCLPLPVEFVGLFVPNLQVVI